MPSLSEAKSICIYCYASSPDAAACRVCLTRKYGRCMLLTDNNLLLPGEKLYILNTIYRKLSKTSTYIHKIWKTIEKKRQHARLTYQSNSLPLQREFGRVALPSVRSNGPTDPLHISCFCSICTSIPLSLWIRQSPLSSTRWHFLFAQEPHVVYCF